MTKMVYTVINRPKKGESGRTDVGWLADNVSNEVAVAGYLITSRTKKGEERTYTAYLCQASSDDIHLGDEFTTRAQAAFAIWRAYYDEVKSARHMAKLAEQNERERRRKEREERKAFRATPEGQKAYREELNAKARERRAAMTPEQKAAIAAKRREKRKLAKLIN